MHGDQECLQMGTLSVTGLKCTGSPDTLQSVGGVGRVYLDTGVRWVCECFGDCPKEDIKDSRIIIN